MEWWSAAAGVAGLAVGAVILRSVRLSFVTLMAFIPLALHTLYADFSRFWILMALVFVVEVLALARQLTTAARRNGACHQPHAGDGCEAKAPA